MLLQVRDVTTVYQPRLPGFARTRTLLHGLVLVAGVLALVLLGLTSSGHSHDTANAGLSASATCADIVPCQGDGHGSGAGPCCPSVHGHACCVLAELLRVTPAMAGRRWNRFYPPRLAGLVKAPAPRPPTSPVA
jgi:hypothetical protein